MHQLSLEIPIEPYRYAMPTEAEYKAVARKNRAVLADMPAPLVKFMAQSYGAPGYAVQRRGEHWTWETPCHHMAYRPTGPRSGVLLAWPRLADPAVDLPAVERPITCE